MAINIHRWLDENIYELGREMRLSYLPPLMIYMALGVSGFTAIVGTFFVKEYLGLSASFMATLGFWAVIPWSLKMPMGHLVDLIWRWKSILVYVGATLITASLLIMVALLAEREAMTSIMPASFWFVLSTLLTPIGLVVQDAVADAMTIEAVPHFDDKGVAIEPKKLKLMHTTMQTLGRFAIIGGSVLVAVINIYMFDDVGALSESAKIQVYTNIYIIALAIPVISVSGVMFANYLKRRDIQLKLNLGQSRENIMAQLHENLEVTKPNWCILIGSLVFVVFILGMGFSDYRYNQEIIFIGSMAIVCSLIAKLTHELEPSARRALIGTAIIIFAFRAVPLQGEGMNCWLEVC